MAARKTHSLGPNQVMALKFLSSGPKSTRQMMQMLGMENLRHAGEVMKRLSGRGMAHICDWENLPTGGVMAVWADGKKQDKVKDDRTASQRQADYRQRVVARVGKGHWAAIQRAQRNKTSSVLVIDGVKIWERGKGILV